MIIIKHAKVHGQDYCYFDRKAAQRGRWEGGSRMVSAAW